MNTSNSLYIIVMKQAVKVIVVHVKTKLAQNKKAGMGRIGMIRST